MNSILQLLLWIDEQQIRYWGIVGFCVTCCTVLIILPNYLNSNKGRWQGIVLSDGLFLLAIGMFVLACRWPILLYPRQLNPDESAFLAAALTLRVDPVFWRSISMGTSGPLNVYPLLIPSMVGLPLDFLSARLIGVMLVIGTISFLYLTGRHLMGISLARATTFATAAFFAFAVDPDFVHYGSEHVPLFLLSAAAFALTKLWTSNKQSWLLGFVVGILTGCVPLAKLQAAPVAAFLGLAALLLLAIRSIGPARRIQSCLVMLFAGLLPVLLVTTLTLIEGCAEHFFNGYVLGNIAYSKTEFSLLDHLKAFPDLLSLGQSLANCLYLQVALSSGLFLFTFFRATEKGLFISRLNIFYFSVMLLLLAIYCVLAPGRHFPHYLLLLVVPVTLFSFVCVGYFDEFLSRLNNRPRRIGISMIALSWVIGSVLLQVKGTSEIRSTKLLGQLQRFLYEVPSPAGKAILDLGHSGGPLGLWGWKSELFVEANMWSGTRDAVLSYAFAGVDADRRAIFWVKYRERVPQYYEELYMSDLKKTNPPVFVDTTGPGDVAFYNRSTFGHETFPPLAAYIANNYRLIDDVGGVRIFLRKDLEK